MPTKALPMLLTSAGWLHTTLGEQPGFEPDEPILGVSFKHEDALGSEPVGPIHLQQPRGLRPLVLSPGGYVKWYLLDEARRIAALLELPLAES